MSTSLTLPEDETHDAFPSMIGASTRRLLARARRSARLLAQKYHYTLAMMSEVAGKLHKNSLMRLQDENWVPKLETLARLELLVAEARRLESGLPGTVTLPRRGRPPKPPELRSPPKPRNRKAAAKAKAKAAAKPKAARRKPARRAEAAAPAPVEPASPPPLPAPETAPAVTAAPPRRLRIDVALEAARLQCDLATAAAAEARAAVANLQALRGGTRKGLAKAS